MKIDLRTFFAVRQSRRFWSRQSSYNYVSQFPERAAAQELFTKQYFLPFLSHNSTVVDVGCADGWHSLQIAHHVRALIGYDMSDHFVSCATQQATRDGVVNAVFHCADIRTAELPRADGVVCAGLLTCLDDVQSRLLLLKIFGILESGGPLLVKDTLSTASNSYDGVTYVDRRRGAFYRSQEKWEDMLVESGYELLHRQTIHETGTGFISRMAIAIRP